MNHEATGSRPAPDRVEWGKTLLASAALLLITTIAIPLAIAAVAPTLTPFTAKFPGKRTIDNPGGPVPATAQAFAPFRDRLGISWDDEFLYIEGNGLPAHSMMKGITAWQQQVPIPHDFTGENRFKLPLKPEVLEGQPQELTLLGPIALAVNGIPIFHSLTQSGKDAYAGGELDEWGGHCGRADDYHYHLAPAHLEEIVGPGNPVAFGLDGHPVYLENPAADKPLDECHGYFDDHGSYRYVGNLKPPYMMASFRGVADLEDRPLTRGVREFLPPLRGAEIIGFSGSLATGYSLDYEIGGKRGIVNYLVTETGVDFEFVDPDGTIREESHPRRDAGGRPPRTERGREEREMRPPPRDDGPSGRPPQSDPLTDALDANRDGVIDSEEIAEASMLLRKLDRNGDGKLDRMEATGRRGGGKGARE